MVCIVVEALKVSRSGRFGRGCALRSCELLSTLADGTYAAVHMLKQSSSLQSRMALRSSTLDAHSVSLFVTVPRTTESSS